MYTQGYKKMDDIGETVATLNEEIKVRKQEADIITAETKKLIDKVLVESEKAALIAAAAAATAERAGLVLAEANAVKQEAETNSQKPSKHWRPQTAPPTTSRSATSTSSRPTMRVRRKPSMCSWA